MRKKTSISFTRDDLLNANIEAAAQSSATVYTLESSVSSILKNGSTLTPSNITFYSLKKIGSGNYTSYTGWFKIQDSTNGTTWVDRQSSGSSGETSVTYTPITSAKFIRCSLYTENTFTNQVAVITVGIIESGVPGAPITIDSIVYAVNQDGSTQPSSWPYTSIPSISPGDWLWIKTTYSDGNVVISKSYAGTNGVSISSVTNYYLATDQSSGVTTATSGWTTNVQTMTSTNQYLWNYEVITGSNGSTLNTSTPCIIGRYGQNGQPGTGITGIQEHYLATDLSSGITTSDPPSGHGTWSTTVQSTSKDFPYLWNYEVVSYTSGTPYTSDPRIIGTHGIDGQDGKTLWGTCTTDSDIAQKTIVCTDIPNELYTGLTIAVKFTNANSENNPSLKITSNGTTTIATKSIYVDGAAVGNSNCLLWNSNAIINFIYDGTNFVVQDQPIIYNATCSTASTTIAKTAPIDLCVIRKGTSVLTKFSNAHNSTTAATFYINGQSSTAKTIKINDKNVTNGNCNTWSDNQLVNLVFDGQYWNATITQNTSVEIKVNSINYINNSAELIAILYIDGKQATPSGIQYKWTKGSDSTSLGTTNTLTISNGDLNAIYNCEINW